MVNEIHGVRIGDRQIFVTDKDKSIYVQVSNLASGGTSTGVSIEAEDALHLAAKFSEAAARLTARTSPQTASVPDVGKLTQ